MNILVIGNGFDLAHELPTRYIDFLEFCKIIITAYENTTKKNRIWFNETWLSYWENNGKNERIKEQLKDIYKSKRIINEKGKYQIEIPRKYKFMEELEQLVLGNFWIEYFQNSFSYQKENWIDFESEISMVIQSLDRDMHGASKFCNIDDKINILSNSFLNQKYSKYTLGSISFKIIRNEILNDLNRLIRAFEIYLCEYVEKLKINKKSPDIDSMDIDHVLSFNYTHTFLRIYKIAERIEKSNLPHFNYIHGEALNNNRIETNNMVLGIDEYLLDERKNRDIDFIAFKKYYQRIYKQTGCEYKKWVEVIKNRLLEIDYKIKKQYPEQIPYEKIPNKFRNQLYIFGHSLDITDKDVLRDLILNNNVYTTIFYPNKEELGRKIANLVKVIGQDELIRRTGGSTKTIEFKLQQDMIPIGK